MTIKRIEKTGYQKLRKGRVSNTGQCYLVTTICQDRHRRFAHWDSASAVSALLAEPRLWRDSRVLCWVLMPDHLHAIVELGGSESLSRLMQRVKAVTAKAANGLRHDRNGGLWMPGFHDRALRRGEDVLVSARYLIANPLRARLAESVGEYPYWDAVWVTETTGFFL